MNQQLPMPQAEEIHLQDYINVILRRRYTFFFSFTAVLAAVVLFILFFPPLYQSTATLFVKDDKGKIGQMGDLLLSAATPVDDEVEILKSRSNAEKVVEKLHLNWKIDRKSDDRVSCKVVEFTTTAPALDEPVYLVDLLGGGAYAVRDDEGNSVGKGAVGALMRGKGITLLIADLKGEKGDSFRLTMLPFNETVQKLQKKMKIEESGKKTDIITVAYKAKDPLLAKDVVDTLVRAYLEQGVVLRAQEATLTVGFVEEQLKGIKAELEQAEKNLQAYKSASGVIALDPEAENLIQTLSDAEKQKAEAVLQRKQAEYALASLKDAKRRGVDYSPALMREDPVLASMASKLAELKVLKKGQLSDATESHPGVKSVQAQIEELEKKIQATYETTLKNTLKQERDIAGQISEHDVQLKRLPYAERELARLTRIAKVDSDIYTFLLQKHEEAKIAKASTVNNVSVLDPPIADDKPVFPKKVLMLALGLVAGCVCGVGLCFFQEYLDDTLKDPEQAKNVLALPMLAVIPYISSKGDGQAMVTHHSPRAPASEAFRALRTGLHFSGLNRGRKVLLVTSSFPEEGKSMTAANLAITLAQTGSRVLILDCDLRRSTLHDKFGMDNGQGLTELLAGDIAADAAIVRTPIEGLDLIKAGTVPPNPSEILGSDSMRSFIEEMKQSYTHLVIDAPPVLPVTDALVLSPLADQVLLVVEAGRVPLKAALRTKESLVAAAAPIAGFVVSDKTSRGQGYGYGYGYGYGVEEVKKPWWKFKSKSGKA